MSNKPQFQRRIFWDVDFDKLDYDKHANFVIERVFDRGDVEDIRQCRRYYGDSKVSDALLNAKYLMFDTIYLASAVINKPIEDFRCYRLRQLNPGLYPY
ncbi:MAG: hypothetical protein LBM68_02835 [Bacteroidales bacterium]|jgi:hypothetical protein|nr:hypothetical protein [Bacteroidales bacterium]